MSEYRAEARAQVDEWFDRYVRDRRRWPASSPTAAEEGGPRNPGMHAALPPAGDTRRRTMLPTGTTGGGGELAAHHAWLLRLARRLARDEAQAEDLAQGAWAELARRGTHAVRDLRAYLAGIVRVRAARERVAAHARTRRETEAARAEALPSTAALVERLELARLLAEELARLPEDGRTLLLLHHQEGVSLAAIARARGEPEGTVRSRITRARQALRAALDRRFDGRRESWAAVALAPLARPGLSPREAALAGGLAMTLPTKLALGTAALAAALWLGLRAREAEPSAPEAPTPAPRVVATLPESASSAAAREARPVAERTQVAEPPRIAEPEELRLRLLDARDGTPLPRFALRVKGEGDGRPAAPVVVASDADGELRLDRERFELPLALLALDDPDHPLAAPQEARLEPDAHATTDTLHELSFRVGPTYSLVFPEPPPPGAEIELSLRPGLEPDLGFGFRGHLRDDPERSERPWTRFDPDAARAAELGTGPWTLTARDRAGLWFAWGEVHRIEGVQPEPVLLRGGARGALSLSVTIGGEPIESVLSARLHRLTTAPGSDAEDPEPKWLRRLTFYPASRPGFPGSGGHGPIPWVEPGTYLLRVGGAPFEDQETRVQVVAGEVTELAFDFTPRTDVAPLEVILRSQTGRAALAGLALTARAEGQRPSVARMAETRADGSVRYVFDALPEGEWEVELGPTPFLPRWERTLARARPGTPPLEFLCLDEGAPPARRCRVRVVDARSGAPIAAAGIRTFVAHESHLATKTDADGEASVGPYPADAEVEVHARAGGHAGRLVTLPWATSDDTDEPVVIALDPGWGALLEVVAYDGQREHALDGVEVRLDGTSAGTTDALGRLLLSRPTPPTHVELLRPGYHVTTGDLDASGTLRAQEQYGYRVTLERDR